MTRANSNSGYGTLTVTLHGRGLLKVPAECALLSRAPACPPGLSKYWGTVFLFVHSFVFFNLWLLETALIFWLFQ